MKRVILGGALLAALMLVATGCAANTEAPAATTDASDGLYGSWRMTSLEATVDGEYEDVPYSGQILFTEDGRMGTQAMNLVPDAADTDYTVQGYEAYYGALTVDEDSDTFSVDIESSAARGLIGQHVERNYEITDDTLVITPVDAGEGWRVTYERF